MRLTASARNLSGLLEAAVWGKNMEVIKTLFELGAPANDTPEGGSSLIHSRLQMVESFASWWGSTQKTGLQSPRSDKILDVVDLLCENGGKWICNDASEISSVRRGLCRMAPRYTVRILEIMVKWEACTREQAQNLIRTPAIKRTLRSESKRCAELAIKLPSRL